MALVRLPSQEQLTTTYGGGGFFNPPITQDKVIPSATALIDPNAGGAADDGVAGPAPAGQVTGSPLTQRQQRGGGGAGADTASQDQSTRNVDISDSQTKGVTRGLSALGMATGAPFGLAGAFNRTMQALGFETGILGPSNPQMTTTAQKKSFRDLTSLGRANAERDKAAKSGSFGGYSGRPSADVGPGPAGVGGGPGVGGRSGTSTGAPTGGGTGRAGGVGGPGVGGGFDGGGSRGTGPSGGDRF
jgi:hypothetical protein